MSSKIRVGIAGYGNLGRGVELALSQNADMELVAVFTRRDPTAVNLFNQQVPVYDLAQIEQHRAAIDVLILCGGSKNDLPEQGPLLAQWFTTVDSFDTHARIPEYYAAVDASAQAAKTTALIAVGWDPGLFSLNRVFGEAVLPQGETYTFWGKGLSQGHSDAVRRVPGVKGGVQYTLPIDAAVQRVRDGEQPTLSTREKHRRQCFVVLAEGADAEQVRQAIVTMPDYFADYDTEVNFIDADTLARDHAAMPHGGFVIRSGQSAAGTQQVVEYSLALGSNPEFTSSVLVAYARAAFRLQRMGQYGAKTVFDVAPGLLSARSAAELRKDYL
ncbi:diaminopimelate dehydrogenase [Alcaligenes endophyticus]|uniref:Meso-diaminopimelate D-dehydrogenase n=1 Tax=Alcaligenes endophyticus TaxID=1929088 RepID=A0ABT8EMG7_9BURK|nr:diaminopimelate dehydrogenase [Alcaligenes endophyticus]MCX5590933.1 diaminopimelate dehydrogenase [Alcaligenes endophyticus]MDN4122490.1 diaminopimelate dehydrogenase [Alcaligenes endophyticus]